MTPESEALPQPHDSLERFVFEQAPIQGRIVHLDATWRAVLERRNYPEPVRDILGQFMAASALLAAILKFEGRLIMQAQGDGPVRLLVTECSSEGTMRGLAQWEGDVEPMPLPQLFGEGRLVITIDPIKGKERYQGTVELHGGTIAQALESYFVRSEQLATRLWLAADEQRATGMLLQRLPGHHWQDEDTWERAAHLGSTLTRRELLGLPTGEILHRLYHEDDIRLFARKPVSFRCTCSRERVETVLRMLGQEEIESIVREQGNVRVDCEFCASHYEFDTVDATQLFTAPAPPDTPSTRQ